MRLALADHDILPEMPTAARPEPAPGKKRTLLIGIGVILALGLLLLMLLAPGKKTAEPAAAVDGARGSAVPVATPTAPAAPTPSAQPTLPVAQPPQAQAVGPATVPPQQPKAAEPDTRARRAGTPAAKMAGVARAHVTAARTGAALPPPANEDIANARAALKALDSQPVLSVKPKDEGAPPVPSDQDVIKLTPKAEPPPPEPSSEPPPAPDPE